MSTEELAWSRPRTVGPHHHLVFSYVSQRVDFEGRGASVVTPNEAVLCRPWQAYRSHDVYAGEELTVFVAFTAECADRMGMFGDLAGQPARVVAVPPRALLDAWRLAHTLSRVPSAHCSDLEYTERALRLVTGTLPGSRLRALPDEAVRPRTRQHHRSLVDAVREHLAVSFADRTLPLVRLAEEVGASPYHLARVFRIATGHSIHRYRTQLRLRYVLARLPEAQPLSELAIEAGFSSPSHLSDAFRRAFGSSPSQLRSQLRGAPAPGTVDDSRTNLKVGRDRRP